MKAEWLLRIIIFVGQQSIVPEEEYVIAWIRHFSPFLIWNYSTSRKVCVFYYIVFTSSRFIIHNLYTKLAFL